MVKVVIHSRSISPGFVAGVASSLIALISNCALAQTASLPTTRPFLEQLNLETQELFKDVAPSIVRVQLPLPTEIVLSPDDPLSHWVGRIEPGQLRRLVEMEHGTTGASFTTAEIRPATLPSPTDTPPNGGSHLTVLWPGRVSPNIIGIVLDDQNHLLIPRFVDKAACQLPIPVVMGDGRWATASFVASDPQADLTLLKLQTQIKTKPAAISAGNLSVGSLLLVLSLNPAANRLAVWEGWEPDVSTLVNVNGSIAGFTRGGRFLRASACAPVVQELIAHGFVHRALLGVVIETLAADDPDRQAYPTLGATPALKIREVFPGTVADRAGLQRDDLILSLAGESVGDPPTFAAAIANRRGNTEIAILRSGQRHLINVELQGQ